MDFYFAYKIQKDIEKIHYNLKNKNIKNKNIKNNVNLNNRAQNLNNENKDKCKCCYICGQNQYWCICEIIMTG